MKEKIIEIEKIKIEYKIGENKWENDKLIDEGEEEDIWYHNGETSSCHVLCKLPANVKIERKMRKVIIKEGAKLCKYHTKKTRSEHLTEIIYTELKNVKKTKIVGSVMAEYTKSIIV